MGAVAEKNVQLVITQALDLRGWLWNHNRDSRNTSGRNGLPDLIAVNPKTGAVLWLEVKGPKTRVRPEQQEWLAALRTGGHDARMIRGADEAHQLAADILSRAI